MRRILLIPMVPMLLWGVGCSSSPPPATQDGGVDAARTDVSVDMGLVDGANDAITPTDNPAPTDTTPPPTDNPAPTDTAPPPTDNPAPTDTAPPPTDNPAPADAATDTSAPEASVDAAVDTGPAMDATVSMDATITPDSAPVSDTASEASADTGDTGDTRCRSDMDCATSPLGRVCEIATGTCRSGCSVSSPCPSGQQCCGSACVATQTDVMNCGGCGAACAIGNATPSCVAGVCGIASCNPGYADCDGIAMNGCEVNLQTSSNHCGRCNNNCASLPGGGGTCSAGVCGTSCADGFGDCDGNAANGCETDVRSSADHCGRCGNTCASTNATSRCLASTCFVERCNANFGDCDGNTANGCEANLTESNANCGACGRACNTAMGLGCSRGTCIPVNGLVAWYPLDGDGADRVSGGTAATVMNTTPNTDRFGVERGAMTFVRTSMASVQVTNARLPTGNAARTLSLWMQTTTRFMGEAGSLANWGTTAMSRRYGLLLLPDVAYFVGESDDVSAVRPITDGRWHHLAASYDGTTVTLFIDGLSEVSAPKALNTVGTQLLIGRAILDHYPGRPVPEYFDGIIDDVRVYDRALDGLSINALYQEGNWRP